jgi:hypothetical protein
MLVQVSHNNFFGTDQVCVVINFPANISLKSFQKTTTAFLEKIILEIELKAIAKIFLLQWCVSRASQA